jgi:hypothetical protein
MGASGWQYFIPYESDIESVFQKLRNQVFKSKQYFTFDESIEFDSIEELMEYNEDAGTHSILDTEYISRERGFGLVTPLSIEELEKLFGTDKPTHASILEKQYPIWELRERGEGLYIIAYEGIDPKEIYFSGMSGD